MLAIFDGPPVAPAALVDPNRYAPVVATRDTGRENIQAIADQRFAVQLGFSDREINVSFLRFGLANDQRPVRFAVNDLKIRVGVTTSSFLALARERFLQLREIPVLIFPQ